MLLARLDPGSRSLVYTGAGHPPGYILDHTGDGPGDIGQHVDPARDRSTMGNSPRQPPVTLQPGDLVFLYTDGVVETIGPDGSFFGIERALDVIRSTRASRPAKSCGRSSEASRQFARQEKRARRFHGDRDQGQLIRTRSSHHQYYDSDIGGSLRTASVGMYDASV